MRNRYVIFIAVILAIPLIFILLNSTATSVEIINDRDYVPALVSEIQRAEDSVYVAMFSLTYYGSYSNSSANLILEALADAEARGLDVRVIVDEYPEDHESGVEFLQERSVAVRYDGKSQTTHAKLIIIDSETVFVGSSNWRYYSLDRNHEANVLIKSVSTAEEYEQYFEELWENGNDI